ncbi:MAG TPA: dihydropteroate synthase [Actinomycetota bacterium]|nr:dihydropteroate synthase [Actinomycetota bacterium]
MKLVCRDRVVALDRTVVMGVLNVTPDSFSDGGLWFDRDAAIAHALDMAAAGAAIVDVGGESTRPGAEPVPEDEELRRVVPVIEAVAARADVVVSVDTRKPRVAAAGVEAGAALVNDTAGEAADPAMDDVVARTGVAVAVMHSRGTPGTMRGLTEYDDVVTHVASFLAARARALEERGVARDAIVLDPGFGFAKTPEQNLVLLNRLDEIVALGYPVLSGTSRKSFIGRVLDLPERERVEGTAATVAWSVAQGARIVRVHDVAEMTRVARMTEAIRDAR